MSSAPSYFVRSECDNGFVVHPGSLQTYVILSSTICVIIGNLQHLQRHTIQQADRSKTLDAIKRHQDSINTKSKEITSIRQKLPYKNSIEIQSRIQQLDGQIESGKLKLIDEKKALNEISTLKRSSKQVTTLESLETSIAEDKQQIETLRQVLDDPQAKATQARWDALKKEMDQLREEQKKAYDERGGLFDRRNELSRKMDELYERKRASNAKHRADNDA